ncbi:anti-sigma factor antagonist [Bacteroides oleiciplenus]|uniref:Anti-sigma factor antagonist n=1 Tax=Bacteroides oleiciplenus TaxID=626931 RepID=A0A3E5B1Q8_9BACE|nr:anti-sigma factor antagonist [Bacteroides oleiciplenus]RGN31404.1 STAS domain-containing protein [Bacteroides oleiciplenus]
MEKEIIINNQLNELSRISQFMEELGVSLSIPSEIAMSINLAIEEIIANIIQRSYPDGKSGEIELQAYITPGRLIFQIIDEGVAIDPFHKSNPDEKPSLEEQLTKGLGHFLIHRTMDEVSYKTTSTQNLLSLVKRLDIDFKPDALLDTNICRVDGIIVLDIKGRLDTANARDFSIAIQPLLQEEKPNIIINCEQMSYISSSGLRYFLILQKSVQKNQGSLFIEAMKPEIKHIFEMTGCTSLFNIR